VRYPYDRLLRFFVSRKTVDVNEALERYGLPPVGDIWVANARTKIRDEAPYALTSFIDSDDPQLVARDGILDWADGEGFGELWRVQKEFGGGPPPPAVDTAFRIFMNYHARGTMALLLMARMPAAEISDIFEEKYDLAVPENTFEIYQRIFWDIQWMGRKAWDKFIPKLLTKHERHNVALGLTPRPPDDIRDIVDVGISIDPEDITSEVAATAIIQFKRAKREPNPVGADIKMWGDMALRAAKQLHEMKPKAGGDEGPLPSEGFQGLFSVQVSKSSHPTLAELQGEIARPKAAKVGGDTEDDE
jgi:hypothetical protein